MIDQDSVEIIEFDQLHTLSVKVTQKIEDKYLDKFIKTSISSNHISTTKNSNYYFNFIEDALIYEIIVFECYSPNSYLAPCLLYGFYADCTTSDTTDIFLYENNFIVFQNREFLLLKNIEYSSQDDVEIFVSQTYHLSIDNIVVIEKQQFENIKDQYFEQPSSQLIKFHPLISDDSFRWFKIFTLFCTFIFVFLSYGYISSKMQPIQNTTHQDTSNKQLIKLKHIYNKHNFKAIEKTIELFKYLKIQNIKLISIKYENKKVEIVVSNEKKSKLLNFLTMYDNKVDIKFIEYQKDTNSYIMSAVVHYDVKK